MCPATRHHSVTILTEPKPAIYQLRRFDQQLLAVQQMLAGQLLVSQDRCIDGLLDLYNVAPTKLLRELVGELISDIRFVSTVRAQLLHDDLSVLSGCHGFRLPLRTRPQLLPQRIGERVVRS